MAIVPYTPKPLVPAVTSSGALAFVGEMLVALAAPEVGVPALLFTLGNTLANPQKFAAYMSICSDFTFVIRNTLEVYKLLVDRGFIPGDSNCCEDIAKALYINKGELDEMSIADIFKKSFLHTITLPDNTQVEVGITESVRAIYGTLYYHLDNTTVITITDALARLVLTGIVKTYQGIPQSPQNP